MSNGQCHSLRIGRSIIVNGLLVQDTFFVLELAGGGATVYESHVQLDSDVLVDHVVRCHACQLMAVLARHTVGTISSYD